MKVELIEHMGSDLTVVNAARVSFNKKKNVLDEKDQKLIKYLADHNHFSPFTHPQIQLRVTTPIFVARQLMRHQVGLTVNEVSRRYVDDPPEFYMPSEWRERAENVKQGSGIKHDKSEEFIEAYEQFLTKVRIAYEAHISEGICPEQARMILPQSMYTTWYWTGSLMAFIRVCKLRLDSHTQKETREVAGMIRDIIQPLFSVSWEAWLNGKV